MSDVLSPEFRQPLGQVGVGRLKLFEVKVLGDEKAPHIDRHQRQNKHVDTAEGVEVSVNVNDFLPHIFLFFRFDDF